MTFIRSLFMYAAIIWFPTTSPSPIQKFLQTIQNSALRIATSCVKMTSIDYEENKMLPVQDHVSLISSDLSSN